MNEEKLPIFHETYNQILDVLKNENAMHYKKLAIAVRDKYYANLPESLLNKRTTTGGNTLLDRIGWAKSYLKNAGFLQSPGRGMIKISEKGRRFAAQNITLTHAMLKNDADYRTYEQQRDSKKTSAPIAKNIDTEDASPQDLIDVGILQIEQELKSDLLAQLKKVDPFDFERIVLELLSEMGYGDFIETPKTGDGGIDGILNQDKLGLEKIYMQAKRYSDSSIKETHIRDFIGAMSGDTNKGIFVTTSFFHDKAIEKAKTAHHCIILIDGKKLADLMYQYNVGTQVKNTYFIKEIDGDFFE
jgi:restriction system protein